ncbi:MAG TPA: hypothetical protein VEX43_15475 [Chthoniobacterales bacterium]|nr:hypothetical protein [Chthoniobacterales bacterium]
MGKNGARLGVQKTCKLFIGGKLVRSESGREMKTAWHPIGLCAQVGAFLRKNETFVA